MILTGPGRHRRSLSWSAQACGCAASAVLTARNAKLRSPSQQTQENAATKSVSSSCSLFLPASECQAPHLYMKPFAFLNASSALGVHGALLWNFRIQRLEPLEHFQQHQLRSRRVSQYLFIEAASWRSRQPPRGRQPTGGVGGGINDHFVLWSIRNEAAGNYNILGLCIVFGARAHIIYLPPNWLDDACFRHRAESKRQSA